MYLVNLFYVIHNLHESNYAAAEIKIKCLGLCTHELTLSVKLMLKSHPKKH